MEVAWQFFRVVMMHTAQVSCYILVILCCAGFKWFWVILATKCTCVVNSGFCRKENSCALTVHNHLVNSRQTASVSLRADPKTAVICGWEKSKLKKGIPSVGSGYNVVSDGHDRGTEPYPVLVLVSLSWILFIVASLVMLLVLVSLDLILTSVLVLILLWIG